MATKTVLVTGFGPFREHDVNASWEAVKELKEIGLQLDGFELVTEQLSVEYEECSKRVPHLWAQHEPVLVIHAGVHGDARTVYLEECAHNDGHDIPDNKCHCPSTGNCIEDGNQELTCKMDVNDLCRQCADMAKSNGDKLTFKRSTDAGRYLCNFSYYCSLHLDRGASLFVHVPPLSGPFSCGELALALRYVVHSCLQSCGVLTPGDAP